MILEDETVSIKIPAGDGMQLKVSNKGNDARKQYPGDLIVAMKN
jgi:DnaJ-class molecular chaperone